MITNREEFVRRQETAQSLEQEGHIRTMMVHNRTIARGHEVITLLAVPSTEKIMPCLVAVTRKSDTLIRKATVPLYTKALHSTAANVYHQDKNKTITVGQDHKPVQFEKHTLTNRIPIMGLIDLVSVMYLGNAIPMQEPIRNRAVTIIIARYDEQLTSN